MEYKYHPVLKHLTYFIIIYLFLRHQKLMNLEILLINSVLLTVFVIILDHVFILGHLSPFDSLTEQYFDNDEIINLKDEIKKEEREERKKRKDRKKKKLDEEDNEISNEDREDNNVENYRNINGLKIIKDDQIQKEMNLIQNNKPNKFNNNPDHSEFVNITNNLDNTLDNYEYSHKTNRNLESYPDFLAYNE